MDNITLTQGQIDFLESRALMLRLEGQLVSASDLLDMALDFYQDWFGLVEHNYEGKDGLLPGTFPGTR